MLQAKQRPQETSTSHVTSAVAGSDAAQQQLVALTLQVALHIHGSSAQLLCRGHTVNAWRGGELTACPAYAAIESLCLLRVVYPVQNAVTKYIMLQVQELIQEQSAQADAHTALNATMTDLRQQLDRRAQEVRIA